MIISQIARDRVVIGKYSSSNPEWKSINASLKAFGLQELPAEVLLEMIRNYFKVGIEKP